MEKEIPDILFLGSGENESCLGIKLLSSNHGGQRIKISVDMGGDDLLTCHGRSMAPNPYSQRQNSIVDGGFYESMSLYKILSYLPLMCHCIVRISDHGDIPRSVDMVRKLFLEKIVRVYACSGEGLKSRSWRIQTMFQDILHRNMSVITP